jgi:hypothetical protein
MACNDSSLIYLNASEVASAIGANPFKTTKEMIQSVHDRLCARPNAETRQLSTLPIKALIMGAPASDMTKLTQQEALLASEGANLASARQSTMRRCAKHEREAVTDKEVKHQKRDTQIMVALYERDADALVVRRAELARVVLNSAVEAAISSDVPIRDVDVHESQVARRMNAGVKHESQAAVRQAISTTISVNRGIRAESKIVDAHEQTINSIISDRNEKMRYLTIGGVRIGGKPDGIDRTKGTLIEVKHRRRRFLGFPEYEAIQCEVYMRVFDLKKCTMVEHYDGESRSHVLERCEDRWGRIDRGLQSFKTKYIKQF